MSVGTCMRVQEMRVPWTLDLPREVITFNRNAAPQQLPSRNTVTERGRNRKFWWAQPVTGKRWGWMAFKITSTERSRALQQPMELEKS